ncbi:hypothetical protein ACA910_006308 [Epithemia clementina (nom. ined.)]
MLPSFTTGGGSGGGSAVGPIFYLKWYGQVCPCLEKEEDRQARHALRAVNQGGNAVAWYPRAAGNTDANSKSSRDLSQSVTAVGKNVVKFFQSALLRSSSSSSSLDDSSSEHDLSLSTTASTSTTAVSSSSSSSLLSAAIVVDPSTLESVPAQFMIRDNPSTCKPEIFVDPQQPSQSKQQSPEDIAAAAALAARNQTKKPTSSSSATTTTVGFKLSIALGRVGTVQLHPSLPNVIQILAKVPKQLQKSRHRRKQSFQSQSQPPQSTVSQAPPPSLSDDLEANPPFTAAATAKVLITLELRSSNNPNSVVTGDVRDLWIHHLQVLVEWERQRRLQSFDDYDLEDDEEEDNNRPGNFLTQRAQKAAHFAQREIELQQSKRQREQRKAKFMENNGTGGLKYTALAMMQRGAETTH